MAESRIGRLAVYLLSKPPAFESLGALISSRPGFHDALRHFTNTLPINVEHAQIRQRRMAIPRYDHEVGREQYNRLLRELNPLSITPQIHHGRLYNSFCTLPSPQPLHIAPLDLERLLQVYTNAEGKYGRRLAASTFVRVINSLRKCGMPISQKEVNALLYLRNYDQGSLAKLEREWRYVKRSECCDISTVNIFLKFGVRSGDVGFVSDVFGWCKRAGMEMDRLTYDLVLKYFSEQGMEEKCMELLESMLEDGVVLDGALLNSVIRCLVYNGHFEDAELVVERLVELQHSTSMGGASERRHNVMVMKFLDSLHIQPANSLLFIPSVTFDTFKPLLMHYTRLDAFDPQRVTRLLHDMLRCGVTIPTRVFKSVLQSFKERDVNIGQQLVLIHSFLQAGQLRVEPALLNEMLSVCQKQSRYQNEVVNDIEESWRPFCRPGERKKRELDLHEMALNSVERLMTAL